MTKTTTLPLGLCLLLSICSAFGQAAAPNPGVDTAVAEDLRRQAAQLSLRETLKQAAGAVARQDLPTAAQLYDKAWSLVLIVGPTVAAQEAQETRVGLANVRLELARRAQKANNPREAAVHI